MDNFCFDTRYILLLLAILAAYLQTIYFLLSLKLFFTIKKDVKYFYISNAL